MFFSPSLRRAALIAAGIIAGAIPQISSAAIVVTLSDPGQEYPDFSALCQANATCVYGTETFSGLSATVPVGQILGAGQSFVSSFTTGTNNLGGGYGITGTYTGALLNQGGNQYGGSFNTGTGTLNSYPDASGTSAYSLNLAPSGVPGINYFGVWITAMDATNKLVLHLSDGSTYSFVSSNLKSYINQASNKDAYYGNPNPVASGVNGMDDGEPFAYVNFFDTDSFITGVDFTNTSSSGFESSNDAAGYYNPLNLNVGTLIASDSPIPEASSVTLLAAGLSMPGLYRPWSGKRNRRGNR
jgi:hypothetical protein